MQESSWPTYSLVLKYILFLDKKEHFSTKNILEFIWNKQRASLEISTDEYDKQVDILFETVFKPKRKPKKRLEEISKFISAVDVVKEYNRDDVTKLVYNGLIEEFRTHDGCIRYFLTPEGLAVLHGYYHYEKNSTNYDTTGLKFRFEFLEKIYKDLVRIELKKLQRSVSVKPTLPFARISALLWVLLAKPLGEKNKIEITRQYENISRKAVKKFMTLVGEGKTSVFYKESLLDFMSHTRSETGHSIHIERSKSKNFLYFDEQEFDSLIDQIGMSIQNKNEDKFWEGWQELKKEFMRHNIELRHSNLSNHTPEWERELDTRLRLSVANYRRED